MQEREGWGTVMAGGDYLVIFVLANLVALFGTMLFATVADLVAAGRGSRRPPRP